MQTDYQNLNSFESSVVVLAVVGIALVGTIVFSGLPIAQQEGVIQSLTILDIKDQAVKQIEATKFVFDSHRSFMDAFYVAFTEVAVLPDQAMEVPGYFAETYHRFELLADEVASVYIAQNTSVNSPIVYDGGKILGTMIDLSADKTREETLQIPYGFQDPNIAIPIIK